MTHKQCTHHYQRKDYDRVVEENKALKEELKVFTSADAAVMNAIQVIDIVLSWELPPGVKNQTSGFEFTRHQLATLLKRIDGPND